MHKIRKFEAKAFSSLEAITKKLDEKKFCLPRDKIGLSTLNLFTYASVKPTAESIEKASTRLIAQRLASELSTSEVVSFCF